MLTDSRSFSSKIGTASDNFFKACTICLLTAADLRPSMGDPKSDFIVTMHCVVRPAGFGKSAGQHPSSCSNDFVTANSPLASVLMHACILVGLQLFLRVPCMYAT